MLFLAKILPKEMAQTETASPPRAHNTRDKLICYSWIERSVLDSEGVFLETI